MSESLSSSDCESCNYESDGYLDSSDFDHPNPDTFGTFQHQNFQLPRDLISHITENPCSAKGLEKLQKTCKYFFAKNKIVVINDRILVENNSLICRSDLLHLEMNTIFKYWLAKALDAFGEKEYMKSIFRCSLKKIYLANQSFTLNEFTFLLGDGKIRNFGLSAVSVYDDNEELVLFDQILAKIPYVTFLSYIGSKKEIFSTKTFEKTCALKFKSKLKNVNLWISQLSKDIDFAPLCKFFQMNAATSKEFMLKIQLEMKNSAEVFEKFKISLQSWINEEENKKIYIKKVGRAMHISNIKKYFIAQ